MTILLSDPRVVEGPALDLGTPIDATPEQSDGACYGPISARPVTA
jgi:hypothetical protein